MVQKIGVTDNVAALESDHDIHVSEPSDNAVTEQVVVIDEDLFSDLPDDEPGTSHTPHRGPIEHILRSFSENDSSWPAPFNEIVRWVTHQYLDALDVSHPAAFNPELIESELLQLTSRAIDIECAKMPKGKKHYTAPSTLSAAQIADIILRLYIVAEVTPSGIADDDGMGVLAIYQAKGTYEGTYRRVDGVDCLLENIAQKYDYSMTSKGYSEVERLVRLSAVRVAECDDVDIIPFNNTLFNYRTGERIPFSPEYVFLAKIATNLPEHKPELPTVCDADGNAIWDVESWLADVMPDDATRDYLWHIFGAVLRSRHNWDKMAALYSPEGSNGKGTINVMLRGMIGRANTASVALSDFAKPFGTEPLLGKLLNAPDETAVGDFIKRADDVKALITHDPIMVNRKNKTVITYRPSLFMIVNLNSHLEARDKSESFLRRLTIIPFSKRFIEGGDNKAIKADYVLRPEVHEYVAYKVMCELPKYWSFEEPDLVKQTLEEYRRESQTIIPWIEDCLPRFVGRAVMFAQAHAHYYAWTKRRNPRSLPLEQNEFTRDLKKHLDPDVWIVPTSTEKSGRVRDKQLTVATWLTVREPLLEEFPNIEDVAKWQPDRNPLDPNGGLKVGRSAPRVERGFVRRSEWESQAASAAGATAPIVRLQETVALAGLHELHRAYLEDVAKWRAWAVADGVNSDHLEMHVNLQRSVSTNCCPQSRLAKPERDEARAYSRTLDVEYGLACKRHNTTHERLAAALTMTTTAEEKAA